ncbi:camk family protein kinase [Chrysochromulina tobinii]|uniref:Camk family protein kinase n=1 Tax=Chrysochromulina tobinii TaxID=1460289 RepID=A0A0M0J4Y3_9EUKA|nr:camk family protein kinase [Chrysochromulina tobinii]|eukprot:KOO21273.1 camk family protein kinase [Chrysochromulina sp. CCMP291]
MHEELGTGFSSAVLLASRRDIPGKEEVALKVLPLKVLLNPKSELLDTLKTEVELLRGKVKHPCIVRLIETCCDAKSFFIVLEPLKGGDLLGALANRRFFPEDLAKGIFANVVLAVEHLHKCKLVHRDIKAENLCTIDVNSTEYKLIDFGSCADTSAGDVNGLAATAHYCAPEVLKSAGYAEATGKKGAVSIIGSGLGYNGPASDMWSLGVLLFFMLTRKLPFGSTMDTSGVIVKRIPLTKKEKLAAAKAEKEKVAAAKAEKEAAAKAKKEEAAAAAKAKIEEAKRLRDEAIAKKKKPAKGAKGDKGDTLFKVGKVEDVAPVAAEGEAVGAEGESAGAEAAEAPASADDMAPDMSTKEAAPAVEAAAESQSAPAKPLTKKEKAAAAKAAKEAAAKAEKEKVAAAKAEKEAAAIAKKEEAVAKAKAKTEEAAAAKAAKAAAAKAAKDAKKAKNNKADSADSTPQQREKVEDTAVEGEGEKVVQMI